MIAWGRRRGQCWGGRLQRACMRSRAVRRGLIMMTMVMMMKTPEGHALRIKYKPTPTNSKQLNTNLVQRNQSF